jgi:UDP:flavonoid glycosyltransferase YjiC (YdhE family)
MARVVLAWELGANLGHVAPMRAMAIQLRKLGHDCTFVARDLDSTEEYIEPTLGPVLQAPIKLGAIHNPVRVQVSYASLLHSTGFDEPRGLTGRLRAWRQILQDTRCEALFCDHSPTAVVAAHSLGIPVATSGGGFLVPPVLTPFPSFRADLKFTPEILLRNEAAVLATLNGALEKLKLPSYNSLQQPFTAATHFVLGYPETDQYEISRPEPYCGLPDFSQGLKPEWPPGDAPKIFVYLRPFKDLQAVLTALQKSSCRVIVRIASIPASKLKNFERPGMIITDQSVHMGEAARSCDAFINYASNGNTVEMLLAGKPGLLFPNHIESQITTRRVLQMGAGLTPPSKGSFNVSEAIRRLVDDTALRTAAQGFAARYAKQDRSKIIPDVIDRAFKQFKLPARASSKRS